MNKLTVLLCALFLTSPAFADYMVQSFSPSTNIRASAKANAAIVTKVSKGTKMRVLARNNQTTKDKLWLKVETDKGEVGWVKASVTKFVKTSGESLPASMNAYEAPSASPAPMPSDTEAPAPESRPAPAPSGGEDIPDIEILDSLE